MKLTEAISSAAPGAAIHLPPGVFEVSAADFAAAQTKGLDFQGDGWSSTIVRPAVPGEWIFDNGLAMHGQFHTFRNIGFEGVDPATVHSFADIPAAGGAFRVTSSGYDQGFKFFGCRFGFFGTGFDMEGTDTASEMKFFGCKFHHVRQAVYVLNNPQSFNHEFFGCDVECIFGDAIQINNGGAVKVYGGSWIMFSDVGVPTYVLRGNGSSGAGSFPTVFSGVRFELRGDTTRLVRLANLNQFAPVFRDCLFEDQATQPKPGWAEVGAYSTLDFDLCTFYEMNGQPLGLVASGTGDYGQPGSIYLDRCTVPPGIAGQCSVPNGYGSIAGSRLRTGAIGANGAAVSDFVLNG